MTYTPVENTILNLLKKGSYKTSLLIHLYIITTLVVFRTKFAYCNSSLPHFAFAQCFQFFFQFLTIIHFRVAVDRNLSFVTSLNAVVQLFNYRLDSVVERSHPVESTTLGSSRAVCIHPIHTVLLRKSGIND